MLLFRALPYIEIIKEYPLYSFIISMLAKNMAPMTNTDECWRITDESPYAFSYLPVSLCSLYSLTLTNKKQDAYRGVNSACRREVNWNKLDICVLRLRQGWIQEFWYVGQNFLWKGVLISKYSIKIEHIKQKELFRRIRVSGFFLYIRGQIEANRSYCNHLACSNNII